MQITPYCTVLVEAVIDRDGRPLDILPEVAVYHGDAEDADLYDPVIVPVAILVGGALVALDWDERMDIGSRAHREHVKLHELSDGYNPDI